MKTFFVALFFLSFFSVNENSVTNKRFTYIDYSPDKDWEIEFMFNDDSTFILRDKYGCTKMSQKGTWSSLSIKNILYKKLLVLKSNINVEKTSNLFGKYGSVSYLYTSNYDSIHYIFKEYDYFPLVHLDTIYFIDDFNFLFREKKFTLSSLSDNLEQNRVLGIEDFYIKKIGKKKYIKAFGKGKSKEEARQFFLNCL